VLVEARYRLNKSRCPSARSRRASEAFPRSASPGLNAPPNAEVGSNCRASSCVTAIRPLSNADRKSSTSAGTLSQSQLSSTAAARVKKADEGSTVNAACWARSIARRSVPCASRSAGAFAAHHGCHHHMLEREGFKLVVETTRLVRHCYILQSKPSGQFYVGSTNDLARRLSANNLSHSLAARGRGLATLPCMHLSPASVREFEHLSNVGVWCPFQFRMVQSRDPCQIVRVSPILRFLFWT